MKKEFYVRDISKMFNVSKRTIQYYDSIDLVKPAYIKENGYRVYTYKEIAKFIHDKGALVIAIVPEPLSLALFTPPGEWGADFAVGEGMSFGLPVSFSWTAPTRNPAAGAWIGASNA